MAENLYSPIEVPESPAKKAKGNLTGIPRVVHDSSADLYNCIQEWNGNHLTGVSVINEICNLKITHLNINNASIAYPVGLEELCNSLEDVCSKLVRMVDVKITVLNKIKEVKNHYEGLMKLNEMKNINTPVFTTWRVQEFVELSSKIFSMYDKELQMKLYIKENIAHAKYEDNILLYQIIWVQQPYIENLDLQVEAMLKETTLRSSWIKIPGKRDKRINLAANITIYIAAEEPVTQRSVLKLTPDNRYRFKNYGIQKQPRGHPFYQTTSSTYGYLPPSKHTFPHRYYPLSRSFTSQLSNFGMYRNYSLNV